MPDVKCSEPGCPLYISDPCVKVNALFALKAELSHKLTTPWLSNAAKEKANMKIDVINSLLEDDLGLKEHGKDFNQYKIDFESLNSPSNISRLSKSRGPSPKTFTLECSNGHRHQYQITCQNN